MTQTKKQGMQIRQAENPRKRNSHWIVQTASSLLTCAALIFTLTELTGFQMGYTLPVMLAVGGYLCIMHGLLARYNRQQWFYPGVLIAALVIVLTFRQQILEGFRLFWNRMSDTYTAGTGWVLPKWETQLPAEQSKLCITLFAILIAGITAWLSCLLSFWAPQVPAVLLPGVLLPGMVFFGRDISFPYLLPVLAVAVLLLQCGGWKSKNTLPPVLLSWIIFGIAACFFLLAASASGIKDWTQETSTQVHRIIHEYKYETEHTTLPEGNFKDYQEENRGAQPALIVTMSEPEAMYLRGFTGSTFENDVWKPLDTAAIAKNEDFLYWLNLNAFNPGSQFYAAAQKEMHSSTVTIQNIGACSQYLYVPFSLCAGEYLPSENLNTDGIQSDGERNYVYSIVHGGAEDISQVLEYLQKSNDEVVLKYRQTESAYRRFVYNYYVQVPEEVKQLQGKQWDEIAAKYGTADNLTLQQAQECALTFLSQCFPKTGIPEDMELPLDAARGTSYQYATVAALTLRYFGIPTRYAEGYVITQEMAASTQAGASLTVDSSCARAWVEVYQDGIGWIPMNLTPGMGEMIEEEPDEHQNNGDDVSDSETPDAEEADTPMDEESESPDPDGGTVVKIAKAILFGFLILVLILLLIFLFLFIRRKTLLKQKQRKFHMENRNEAVSWIIADTVLLLEKMGLNRGNGSVRELCEPAREHFGEAYAAELWNMIHLNDRAVFSSHALTEQQWEAALAFRSNTLRYLHACVKWKKRLWIRWVQCLY